MHDYPASDLDYYVERMLPYIMAADARQLMDMPIIDYCQVQNVRQVWANLRLALAVRLEQEPTKGAAQ